jgi:uroporphyrinogen III methyltransferase/synthase
LHVYEAVPEGSISAGDGQLLEQGLVDIITFTSSSTVRNLVSMLGSEAVSTLCAKAKVACIGPITANTAREAGFNVDVIAEEFTIDGLVRALLQAGAESRL